MATGLVFDERFLKHDTGEAGLFITAGDNFIEPEEHVENPRRIGRAKNLLDRSGLTASLVNLPPRRASEEEIGLYHTQEQIEAIRTLCARGGGDAGLYTPVGRDSYEIALLAAGGGLAALEAVMDGQVNNAYALLRPPGHHATATEAMGFCVFNNMAIAGRYAKKRYGLERIMILDWDVHHGNGTQAAFYEDPSVLFISLHEDGYFPLNSGLSHEMGEGRGKGYTVNLPLPAGTGHEGYRAAFDRVVLPLARQFKPELVLISAGQDPNGCDPLAHQGLHSESFRSMARDLKQIAAEFAGGRLVAMHEGGYSTAYAPFCTLAILEELSGVRTPVEDPYLPFLDQVPIQRLTRGQEEAIERTRQALAAYWQL